MHVFTSFLKWGSIGYSLGIIQWDFTRRDYPGNPGRVLSIVPSEASNSRNFSKVYSPPKSHLKHLITTEC